MFLAKKFISVLTNYRIDAELRPGKNDRFIIVIRTKSKEVFNLLLGLKYDKFLHMKTNHSGCEIPVYESRNVLKRNDDYLVLTLNNDFATKINIIDYSLRKYYSTHSMINM